MKNIVNTAWTEIQPPPRTVGRANYLTAITKVEENQQVNLVEIIDVEKVLAEIIDYDVSISEHTLDRSLLPHLAAKKSLSSMTLQRLVIKSRGH